MKNVQGVLYKINDKNNTKEIEVVTWKDNNHLVLLQDKNLDKDYIKNLDIDAGHRIFIDHDDTYFYKIKNEWPERKELDEQDFIAVKLEMLIDVKGYMLTKEAGIPPNPRDGMYIEDEFLGMERYTNIMENGKRCTECVLWEDLQYIFYDLNTWLYNKWTKMPLIESNYKWFTGITRVDAIFIDKNIMSVLVVDGWDKEISDKFREISKSAWITEEKIKDLGCWYRVDLTNYLDDI